MNYKQTMDFLEKYYNEVSEHWKNQKSKHPEITAIAYIHSLERGPDGKKIDMYAKTDFIDKKLKDHS